MRVGKILALGCLAGSLAVPSGADWLVTRDNGRVETRGPWKVQGKRIIFTTADGTLSSLRLAEVDLDASRQVTAAAEEAKKERETQAHTPPPRKSVRVLTDKDFPKSTPPPAEGDGEDGPAASGGEKKAAPLSTESNAIQVTSWTQGRSASLNQLEITGMVQNSSPDLATAVALVVRLLDANNEIIAVQEAALTTRTLRPGQSTSFQAVFPGIIGFSSAKLEPSSIPMMTKAPASEDAVPPAEGDPEPPAR